MIKSVRLALTFWYIGSISLLIILFAGIALFSFKTVLMDNLDQTLYNGGKILEEAVSEYTLKDEDDPASLYEPSEEGDEFLIDELDGEADEIFFVQEAYIQLIASPETFVLDPQVIVSTENLEDDVLPLSQEAYSKIREAAPYCAETRRDIFDFPIRMLSLQIHDRDGRPYILQLALSLENIQTTLWDLLFIFGALFPVLLTILSILGYVFMKRAFSPVKEMVRVTRNITAEDLALRLPPIESRDEIGELSNTFNEMITRLERAFKQIQQFSGDVSHELKTPLAELKCNAEVALRRERTTQEYQEALQNVIEDAERLRQIVEDLLLLARMDAQSLPLAFTPVIFHELFFEVFEEMHSLARQKQLAISFQDIASVTIKGDVSLLKRLLTNLIANAIRYTAPGGEISFALHKENPQAVLQISDTGVGIPEELLPYIFDRFYRVEQSRSHDTGGSGLGLAIAQQIINMHGGKIVVDSTVGQGSTFKVYLPYI